jgi:uncharacterized protein
MSGQIDPQLLSLLVCPKCKGELGVRRSSGGTSIDFLDCSPCNLAYPVEDGIPVMLIEEAKPLAAHSQSA